MITLKSLMLTMLQCSAMLLLSPSHLQMPTSFHSPSSMVMSHCRCALMGGSAALTFINGLSLSPRTILGPLPSLAGLHANGSISTLDFGLPPPTQTSDPFPIHHSLLGSWTVPR
ncbi:hypothetical protein ID866_13230 [Astraeus odoratus]|nr:hypothetical protein ID866_13230 [Astraeus odoratus]